MYVASSIKSYSSSYAALAQSHCLNHHDHEEEAVAIALARSKLASYIDVCNYHQLCYSISE